MFTASTIVPWPTALLFFLGHWLLAVLLQLENVLLYVTPKGKWRQALGRSLLLVLSWQTENILVAAGLGLLALGVLPSLLGRWLYFTAYALLTAYLLLEQLYYKRFFDHFRPSRMEGVGHLGARAMLSSIGSEMDGVFRANALLAGCCLLGLGGSLVWFSEFVPPAGGWGRAGVQLLVWGAGLLLLLGLPAAFSRNYHHLQRHPFLVLLQGLVPRIRRLPQPVSLPTEPKDSALLSEAGPGRSHDAAVAAAGEAIRRSTRKPNVILVVLESVGAPQLFGPEGKLSAEATPHLAELSRHAILFDAIYSLYPLTIRAYLPLETGGVHPAGEPGWGDAIRRYTGTTLPRHFATAGYRTALFSSVRLDQDAMGQLTGCMGYDKRYDISQDREHFTRRKMIHGWGCYEEHTLERLEQWIQEGQASEAPFFVLYWTCATHHPYGIPPGYSAPFPGDDLPTRYRNALHYTDASLARLIQFLQSSKQWDNTIVAITGDHGEAFGDLHPMNHYHSSCLFEENVRSFLLLLNPALDQGPIVSTRQGHWGDLLPTLADLAGLPIPEVPGRSLCAGELEPRSIFFFSLSGTEQWGLRDGQWKFIQGIDDRHAELFDLSRDPTEQENLAALHPERVRVYELRCQEWFARSNEEFRTLLSPESKA